MNTEETTKPTRRFDRYQVEQAITYLRDLIHNLEDSQSSEGLECLIWNYRQKEELARILSEACKTKDHQLYDGLGVPQGSAEHRSEAQPECGPADRQPPKSEVLPQETTTQNIKTPTLQEIKDQVAREHGYLAWDHLRARSDRFTIDQMADKAARLYAKAYAEADRKDCAAQATAYLMKVEDIGCDCEPIVDQDSILNRPLPKMI